MTDSSNSDDRAGWEAIWRSADIPPRYRSFAPPNASVVEWETSLPAGGFVLDVGCGVGRHCVYLGGRGFRVAGVDISASGVQIAQKACAEREVTFDGRVSDMTTLPWSDANFDGALSISTIHHHLRADILKALAEVRRVLKPGGLFLVDFPSTDALDYQEVRRQVDDGLITEIEPNTFVNKGEKFSEGDDSFLPHHFCDEADTRDLLRSFEIIKLSVERRSPTSESGSGRFDKWVASVRKPLSG